jgi:hypothetical protein
MGASVVDRFRQPEYTGENRCTPCTIVNAVIAVVGAGVVVGAAVEAGTGVPAAAGLGGAALAVSLSAIYLRGYLVPYTPQLTKRYFPDRVLAWFDKAPAQRQGGLAAREGEAAPVAGAEADVDPEPILLEAGAIEVCRDGEDLCPTEAFADEWREEVAALRDGGDLAGRIATAVGVDAETVDVSRREEFVLVRAGGEAVARWESYPALLADMAAHPLLADRVPSWDDYGRRTQGALLNGARVFLERCPGCDGELSFSRDTVESCCRSVDVVALTCDDCGARLLEVET